MTIGLHTAGRTLDSLRHEIGTNGGRRLLRMARRACLAAFLAYPNIKAALERGGVFPPPPDVSERLAIACENPEVEPDGILEISRADWGTEDQSAPDVLVVQTKKSNYS